MTKRLTLCLLGCCTMAATAMAQDIPNDSVKTPEYIDPMEIYVPEPSLMKYVPVQGESAARRQARMRAAADLPDHWNNAETRYFPLSSTRPAAHVPLPAAWAMCSHMK